MTVSRPEVPWLAPEHDATHRDLHNARIRDLLTASKIRTDSVAILVVFGAAHRKRVRRGSSVSYTQHHQYRQPNIVTTRTSHAMWNGCSTCAL